MRILFTAPRYHTNQHHAMLALRQAGHEVAFFALRRGQSEEYSALVPQVLGYSLISTAAARVVSRRKLDELGDRWTFPPVLRFWREVRRFRPSVVVIRNPNTAYGLLSLAAAKTSGAKPIFYTQGPQHRRLGLRSRLFRELTLRIAGAEWITPVKGNVSGTRPLRRVHYVPFVHPPMTPPEDRVWFQGGVVNVLEIGKFQPRKGHLLFLEAIARLRRDYPLRATIVGECSSADHKREMQRVRDRIRELQLEDIVTVKLNLAFAEVQREYAAHDVFVLPSWDEPAAVSPLEAMAHSLPVVCSDSNGTRCYVRPGENGAIFASKNVDDLVVKLRDIVRDRQRLVAMGARSYSLVVEEHSPQRYVHALCAIAGRVNPQG